MSPAETTETLTEILEGKRPLDQLIGRHYEGNFEGDRVNGIIREIVLREAVAGQQIQLDVFSCSGNKLVFAKDYGFLILVDDIVPVISENFVIH